MPPSVPPVLLVVDPFAPPPNVVAEAAGVLAAGGLVAFPTETVYGLGARALDPRAIARIYAAKGRPSSHPLIAHVLDQAQARALAASWPAGAEVLANAFWPGPLTLVVDRDASVADAVSGGGSSIAIRVPAHPVARALIEALGEPIAAPSANRYQGVSPTSAYDVVAQLGAAVDLVVDGGSCDAGIESTVVDVRYDPPRLLRLGAVSLAMLRKVIDVVVAPRTAAPTEAPRDSPGMDARHYAPSARLILADTQQDALQRAMSLAEEEEAVGLIVREPGPPADARPRVVARALPDDPVLYAQLLYRTLHDLDYAGVAVIVVQAVPADDAWAAVADRLKRAATPVGHAATNA